jgi:hypothetical protein
METENSIAKTATPNTMAGRLRTPCSTRLLPLLLLLALPAAVQALDYTYTTNDCCAITITGYTGTVGVVSIPDTIYNLPVTSIGAHAFLLSSILRSVTIGTNVTSIGLGAFASCSYLTNAIIGSSVTNIEGGAFYNCPKLATLTIPGNVTSIAYDAFDSDWNLTNLTIVGYSATSILTNLFWPNPIPLANAMIGSSVTNIGDFAFYRCSSLRSVTIGPNVTSIGMGAFYGCGTLISVAMPNSVTSLGAAAFYNCGHMTTATIGTNIPIIGDFTFAGCALTSITIPNSVTSIGDDAFSGCQFKQVTIPNGVTSIGDYAFYGTSITNVTIPGNVTNIGTDAFADCYYLAAITVDTNNPAYSSVAGVLFDKSQSILIRYPESTFPSHAYTVPTSVTNIFYDAFYGCGGVTSITMGTHVTSIGTYAFSYCSVQTITIPTSITSIPDGMFEGSSLWSVTIPNSVTNIGAGAFWDCRSLTSITIPYSVTSIATPFSGCDKLTAITVDTNNPAYSSVAGVLFDKSQTTLIQYPAGNAASSYTIPNGVTDIGNSAFYFCNDLYSITIPNSVSSIGADAFWACTSLQNITMSCNFTSIGDDAFCQCYDLSGVYFKGNAPSVGLNVFENSSPTVYYLPGSTGWGASLGGRPTALWFLPNPLILTVGPSFGVQTNRFGFIISWATNVPVVVEACTNLANPIWSPLQTNTLTNGSLYFNDPEWTNYPARLYRLRSP